MSTTGTPRAPRAAAVRRPRAAEATTLATACALAAVVCAGLAVVPFSATAHRGLSLGLALTGAALAAALRRWADVVPAALLHAVVALATGLVTLTVATATTASGTAVTLLAYTWVAVFSATFHTRRALVRHLAGIGVGMAAGLVLAGAESPVQTWCFFFVTLAGVASVLHGRVGRLRDDARLDDLTGALSRGAFADAARTAMARAARDGRPVTLAVLDLDRFKAVNDRHGHAAGDALLRRLSGAWLRLLRGGDVLGRLGGDEFAVLLPGTDGEGAAALLARLADGAREASWSSGLATWAGPHESLDAWMRRADLAMYAAKPSTAPPA